MKKLIKLKTNINKKGNNRGRILHIMHYGPNNYIQWFFADSTNYQHTFSTPSYFFNTNIWYYICASVDYPNGKYSGYSKNIKLK